MLNRCQAPCPYPQQMDRLSTQTALLVAAFVAGALIAGALGAVSLGVAFSFGQIAFTLGLGWFLLRA